jgi:hypothetical protein
VIANVGEREHAAFSEAVPLRRIPSRKLIGSLARTPYVDSPVTRCFGTEISFNEKEEAMASGRLGFCV